MTTIHRAGFMYILAQDGRPPFVTIGRPEAMALIRQANGGKLPVEYNFDVVRRCYWQATINEASNGSK